MKIPIGIGAEIVNRDHCRMIEDGGQTRFIDEFPACFSRSVQLFAQSFDCDIPPQSAVMAGADDSRPAALLLVLSAKGSTPVKGGALMGTDRLGNNAGTIGGGCGENAAILAARRLMGTGESRVVTVDMTHDGAAMEGMVCGGTMDVLIQDLPVSEA